MAPNPQRELPMLAGIAGMIRWLEELVNMLSGPLLTIGLGIALVDLLTDGQLLTTQPFLLYAWAVSQAVGVDAQLVGAFDKARQSLRERHYGALVGMLILGIVLAYVAWVAAQIFGLQQAEGITTSQALARLGMNSTAWLVQRSLLSVILVALSGWTRYHPPASAALSEEEEAERLEREIRLGGLRQQLQAQKALGVARLGRNMLAAARGQAPELPEPDLFPTGGGSPLSLPVADEPITQPSLPVVAIHANEPDTSGERETPAASADSQPLAKRFTPEQREDYAFGLMLRHPEMRANANALKKALQDAGMGCRWETAQAYQVRFSAQQRRIGPVAQ